MKEVIISGFGGQGVLTGGLALAHIALQKDLNVTWMPSYGPEMRGGKSKCVVKFGETPDETISIPMMAHADVLIAMNQLALDYLKNCKDDAVVIVNSDTLAQGFTAPAGMTLYRVPSGVLAYQAENPKGSSIVMLGALVAVLDMFEAGEAKDAISEMFLEKGKGAMDPQNRAAFDAGYRYIKEGNG